MTATIIQHRFSRDDARGAMDAMLGHEQAKAVHLAPRRMGGLESTRIGDVGRRHGRTGDDLENPSTTVDAESRELAPLSSDPRPTVDGAAVKCPPNFPPVSPARGRRRTCTCTSASVL